jgi:hypothetical protein
MNLARQINSRLDELLEIESEIKRMNSEITDKEILTNINTGDKISKTEVIKSVSDMKSQIVEDLNKLTNGGKNCRDIFTNDYYVNDLTQDKEIVQKQTADTLNKSKPKDIESN